MMRQFSEAFKENLERARSWFVRHRRLVIEVGTLSGLFIALYVWLAGMEAFEAFYEYSRSHDAWELDEVAVALVPALIIAIGVAVLRALDARRSQREMRDALTQVEELYQQQRELRASAEDANRSKSIFLTNMSHELRTPLNAIIGYSEIVIEDLSAERPNHPSEQDLARVIGGARHLLTLINDILDLSKIEAGKSDVRIEALDVAQLVDEVVALCGPIAEKNGVSLSVSCTAVSVVQSDPGKVRQCLLNLMSNACKFASGGQVSLIVEEVRRNGRDLLRFCVQDNGVGMTPDQVSRLFTPFQQADSSISARFGGTGLGLSITRELARLLGGDARIESEMGVGTRAELTIAVDAHALVHEGVNVSPLVGDLSQPLALVIDDKADARDLVARALAPVGFAIQGAGTARAGLRLARERTPSVIILDVFLPDASGWTVLEQLKADPSLAATPVIVLSISDDRSRSVALGAAEHIVKPIARDRLAATALRLARAPVRVEDQSSEGVAA